MVWIKISGIDKAKQIIDEELTGDPKKVLVYDLSDGKSSDDIEKILQKKVSDMTIRNWWKKWARRGIMNSDASHKGRFSKLFNLEDFGIEIPSLSEKDATTATQEVLTEEKEGDENGQQPDNVERLE